MSREHFMQHNQSIFVFHFLMKLQTNKKNGNIKQCIDIIPENVRVVWIAPMFKFDCNRNACIEASDSKSIANFSTGINVFSGNNHQNTDTHTHTKWGFSFHMQYSLHATLPSLQFRWNGVRMVWCLGKRNICMVSCSNLLQKIDLRLFQLSTAFIFF